MALHRLPPDILRLWFTSHFIILSTEDRATGSDWLERHIIGLVGIASRDTPAAKGRSHRCSRNGSAQSRSAHLLAGPSRSVRFAIVPTTNRNFPPAEWHRPLSSLIRRRDVRYGFGALPFPRGSTPIYRRLKSTDAAPVPLAGKRGHAQDGEQRTEEEQRAYDRLRPIISALPGPVDWAVAYGSGVRHQANADPSGKPPMTDFLLSTASLTDFHTANLRQNPSHYPLTARLLGGARIAWLTDNWGAGVWYVTMVQIRGLEVKYGVISTDRLKRDFEGWETLYVAGRLHKPVLPLLTSPALTASLQTNRRSALCLSLLLLPPTFSETALWTQIAGISYAGDPRMSVPGAEHPDKIANIVKGKGALEGMRALYCGFFGRDGLNISWEGGGSGEKGAAGYEWVWRGRGEEHMRQPDSPEYLASLLMSLPPILRANLIKGHNVSAAPQAESVTSTREKDICLAIVSGKQSSASSQDWRNVLLQEVASIIRRPATTQSLKGLFTAGFRKSFVYALAKFQKWLNAKRQGVPRVK